VATEHRTDVRPGGWGNRDFHDEVPPRQGFLRRGVTAAIVAALTFVVMLFAIQHESRDCGSSCSDGDGILARQPGHAWTSYQESWQWQAQWALGVGAFLLAFMALCTSSRHAWRHWTLAGNIGALVLAAAWIAWRLLEPTVPTSIVG
jgi:hypothetical protein